MRSTFRLGIVAVWIFVVLHSARYAIAQPRVVIQTPVTGQTAAGDVLRGEGAFLRGLGSYNLNTAKADSINLDTLIRWKQDLRNDQMLYRESQERTAAGKKLKKEEQVRQRQLRERELRISPTPVDIQNGQALNALLYDLTDPNITQSDWSKKSVPLPEGLSVKDLIFRFTPLSGSSDASKALSRGVIALSRLDVNGNKWPTVMNQEELEKDRHAYELAYANLRDNLIVDKPIHKSLSELDRSLDALKAKVESAVPKERGFREEAIKYVKDLNDATRMFDATTVDYSREILIDTRDHDATTVGELVGFMLKYRLQFASAERSASGRVLYGQVYEGMRQQANTFGIEPPKVPEAIPSLRPPSDASNFKGKKYKAFSEKLTWRRAQAKCVELGGHLVSIESAEENDFIVNLATKANLETIWIGANDEEKEGHWVWTTGRPLKYSYWAGDQPNNWKGNENYAQMLVKANVNKWKNQPGVWNDIPDEEQPGFICQWD